MSDTLADLASWLPSEFLSGDFDDKTPFSNNPHRLPYDFASSSSTESESDDDDVTGLTRRFTRSVSLQERLKIPFPVEKKRVFSGSPESTLNWNISGPTQVRSSPATPYVRADEDAWHRIYAAAEQVARMKKTAVNDGAFVNRGPLGAPRPPGPPLSHRTQNCAVRSVNEAFIREQQFRERVSGVANYGGGGRFVPGSPAGFCQSACLPHLIDTQRRRQPADGFVFKPVSVSTGPTGGCSRANAVVKKGCAGTGVFLPRNYSNVPPESKIKPVCSSAHLPARVPLSLNKNLDPIIIGKAQANINGVFSRQYQVPPVPNHNLKCDELAEMIMVQRQNAVMLAQQRRTGNHESVPATRLGQTEVVLPQEWTY